MDLNGESKIWAHLNWWQMVLLIGEIDLEWFFSSFQSRGCELFNLFPCFFLFFEGGDVFPNRKRVGNKNARKFQHLLECFVQTTQQNLQLQFDLLSTATMAKPFEGQSAYSNLDANMLDDWFPKDSNHLFKQWVDLYNHHCWTLRVFNHRNWGKTIILMVVFQPRD